MMVKDGFVIQDGILLDYLGTGGTVAVPDGVIGICEDCNMTGVEELILPESLLWAASTSTLDSLRLKSLRRLVLPGTLRVVPSFLCFRCTNLEEVVIPEGVISIGERAFSNTGLRSVTIPDSVQSIGEFCFENCQRLEEVSLGKGVLILSDGAFAGCRNLRTISLPDSLLLLQDMVFQYCLRLKSVHAGRNLVSVGSNVFAECRALEEVEFPAALETVHTDAFGGTPQVKRVTLQGNRVGIHTASSSRQNTRLAPVIRAPRMLPEWFPPASRLAALKGWQEMKAEGASLDPEIAAAGEAFAAGAALNAPKKLTDPFRIVDGILCAAARTKGRVVVPDGVTGIRAEAFQGTSIREIYLPDSVEWIQAGAFLGCGQLKTVHLPAGLTRIPEALFQQCCSLRHIRLPGGVTCIEQEAFMESGLERITLPPSLEFIASKVFSGCSDLRHVRFPKGLQEIQWDAFSDCPSLTEVNLPDSLYLLAANAFSDCESLKRVSIGAGLHGLDYDPVRNCSALSEVTISADPFFLCCDCFIRCPERLQVRLESSFVCLGSGELSFRVIAPNADPTLAQESCLRPLLLGFASENGRGFRYADRYLELLRLHRRELWDSEPVLRFLLSHDMLEREDIPDRLDFLQARGDHELVAEVLEYCHRRFPEPAEPLLLE